MTAVFWSGYAAAALAQLLLCTGYVRAAAYSALLAVSCWVGLSYCVLVA